MRRSATAVLDALSDRAPDAGATASPADDPGRTRAEPPLCTEFHFVLPRGYVAEDGVVHELTPPGAAPHPRGDCSGRLRPRPPSRRIREDRHRPPAEGSGED